MKGRKKKKSIIKSFFTVITLNIVLFSLISINHNIKMGNFDEFLFILVDPLELGNSEAISINASDLTNNSDNLELGDNKLFIVNATAISGIKQVLIDFDGTNRSMSEIGNKLGITRERVRQIEAQARHRIRNQFNHNHLVEYLKD